MTTSSLALRQAAWLLTMIWVGLGCGKTEFAGAAKSPNPGSKSIDDLGPNGQPKDTNDLTRDPLGDGKDDSVRPGLTANWNWTCPDASDESAADTATSFTDEGPHRLALGGADALGLKLSGELCPPGPKERDIVLLIDVSGSMDDNDRYDPTEQNCARLAAVKSVLAGLPGEGSARVAIATFDHRLRFESGGFYVPSANFLKDLEARAGQSMAATICEAAGDTRFDVALGEAETLWQDDARADASREVYLVTDGLPDAGTLASRREQELAKGVAEAARIKASKAIIATVMLGDVDESHLKSLASRDAAGEPLHRKAREAKSLAKILAGLTTADVKSGRLTLSAIGDDDDGDEARDTKGKKDKKPKKKDMELSASGDRPAIVDLDLTKLLEKDSMKFTTEDLVLDPAVFPTGVLVEFEYRDSLGRDYHREGRLVWE